MLKIYSCIAYAHDLRLVGLAAVICVLASFTAITLLRHARKSPGNMQMIWLAVSATSTGFGIWATHFVAMLAFSPGVPSGYNVALTGPNMTITNAVTFSNTGTLTNAMPIAPGQTWTTAITGLAVPDASITFA